MVLDTPPYQILPGLVYWAVVVLGATLIAMFVGLLMSLSYYGKAGPNNFVRAITTGIRDLTSMSWKRILALTSLTFKEAYHRKAFMIFVVFILLFMFAGWFLSSTDQDKPAKVYVSFVMTSIRWLLIPMALLISCWGLPADIKDRSLHTVVTKPARRSEIVLGRMLGYISVVTMVLAVVSLLFYVWVQRQVPDRARNQLIARVPIYAPEMLFLDRNGNQSLEGTNVGDPWDYRGYVEGLTQARAVWRFRGLNPEDFRRQGGMKLEQKFEAFRTYKGDVDQQIRFSLTLVNRTKNLSVRVGSYPVQEFKNNPEAAVIEVPLEIPLEDFESRQAQGGPGSDSVSLFDLFDDDTLTVEVGCVDGNQFVGASQNDLFVRMPDNSFGFAYSKAVLSVWLMLVLIVALGTTASCFLKGPVATMLTLSLIVLGYFLRGYMQEQLTQLVQTGKITGGGLLEATYRLPTHMNPTVDLPENTGTAIIKTIDTGTYLGIGLIQHVIPNFTYFDTDKFVANGFDISWDRALLPSIAVTAGFFIPLVILGYFSLQLRELESK